MTFTTLCPEESQQERVKLEFKLPKELEGALLQVFKDSECKCWSLVGKVVEVCEQNEVKAESVIEEN